MWKNFETALQQLPNNIKVVFDNLDFPFSNPYDIKSHRFEDALRCGWSHYREFKLGGSVQDMANCSCIFDSTSHTLSQSDHLRKVEPDLYVDQSCQNQSGRACFDVDSPLWKNSCGNQVGSLNLYTNVVAADWTRGLFCSIPGLHRLDTSVDVIGKAWNGLPWSSLLCIDLTNGSLPCGLLLTFITAHKTTLESLLLCDIETLEGTWLRPLQLIMGMEQLYVKLRCLRQQNRFDGEIGSLHAEDVISEVVLSSDDGCRSAAEVLGHGLRTLTRGDPRDTGRYVDLRPFRS